jgi:uncharacterized iron-regulated membrane protein
LNRAKAITKQLHGWIGAVTAVFLLLVALSGASLAFMSEMFMAQYGDMLRSEATAQTVTDLDAVESAARQAGGDGFQPLGLLMPHSRVEGVETILLFGGREGSDYPLMVSVDPATAAAKGMFRLDHAFGHELIDFHYQLLMGDIGTAFVAMLGLLLVIFAASGIYLWWPTRRRLAAKLAFPNAASRRRNIWLSLHGWFGVWAALAIMLFSLTGVATAKPDWLGITQPSHEAPASAGFDRQCTGSISVGDAARTGARLYPDHRLMMLDFPDAPGVPYSLYLRRAGDWDTMEGDTILLVHPTCAGVTHSIDRAAESVIDTAALSIHGGYSFGPILGDLLVIATGLALALLSISGLIQFLRTHWRRRRPVDVPAAESLVPAE